MYTSLTLLLAAEVRTSWWDRTTEPLTLLTIALGIPYAILQIRKLYLESKKLGLEIAPLESARVTPGTANSAEEPILRATEKNICPKTERTVACFLIVYYLYILTCGWFRDDAIRGLQDMFVGGGSLLLLVLAYMVLIVLRTIHYHAADMFTIQITGLHLHSKGLSSLTDSCVQLGKAVASPSHLPEDNDCPQPSNGLNSTGSDADESAHSSDDLSEGDSAI